MDTLKVVFYSGVGLVALVGLGLTISTVLSDVDTPTPVQPEIPGLGGSDTDRQVLACRLEARIPLERGHTLTSEQFQAFMACIDRKIQVGELRKSR